MTTPMELERPSAYTLRFRRILYCASAAKCNEGVATLLQKMRAWLDWAMAQCSMASNELKKKEKDLQVAVVLAVYYGYTEALERAAQALNTHFIKYETSKKKTADSSIEVDEKGRRRKTTGPQMLDFLVESCCCYSKAEKKWRHKVCSLALLTLSLFCWMGERVWPTPIGHCNRDFSFDVIIM